MTGLPGLGQVDVAAGVEARLLEEGRSAYVLDGDNLRHGLNGDLGFSAEDRAENVRRTAEVSALLADAGVVVLVALVSPYRADRDAARAAHDGARAAVPRGVGRDAAGGVRAARPEGALRAGPRRGAQATSPASTTPTSRPSRRTWSCGRTSRVETPSPGARRRPLAALRGTDPAARASNPPPYKPGFVTARRRLARRPVRRGSDPDREMDRALAEPAGRSGGPTGSGPGRAPTDWRRGWMIEAVAPLTRSIGSTT